MTFGLTNEVFGLFQNVVGLVYGIILGLAVAQVFVVLKQKMQWERIRCVASSWNLEPLPRSCPTGR